jgi:hypothetical protein
MSEPLHLPARQADAALSSAFSAERERVTLRVERIS